MRMQQIALKRHMSIAQSQTVTPEEQLNTKMATHKDHSFLKHQHVGYGSLPVYQCRQAYLDDIQDNISRNQKEGILPRSSKVIVYRDTLNYNQSSMGQEGGNQARVQRSVTFDLSMEHALFVSRKEGPYKINKTKMSETLGQESKPSQRKISTKGNRSSTHPGHSKFYKARSQGNYKPKVKFNLNPLRRSKVYPKSGSKIEEKDVKRTSKKIKKDKSQKSMVKKHSEGHESEEKSKKGKSTEMLQSDESSTNPGETQSLEKTPEESGSLMQSSNLLAESTEPLGTANSTDPQVPNLGLNLPVSTPDDARNLQKEFHMPQDGEKYTTPVLSTVSVVQEYLPSGDGSPKRKIRLIVPEKTSSRPQTALEKKIR